MKNKDIIGNILLLLVAAIWGTAFVFQRIGMDSIQPVTFTAARMSLAAVAVSLVSALMKKTVPEGVTERECSKNSLLGGICCGFFLVTASILQQIGIVTTTAGKAGFITAMYILIVPVFGSVFLRRRNSWHVWLSVALGVAGLYLLCMTGSFSLARGDALICICAVLFSGHILCIDHFVAKGNAVRIAAIQFTVTALVSWVIAFITETPGIQEIKSAVIPILYCGLVSGGVGYTLQVVAQKFTEPTVASLLMSLEAVFAATSGALILHERMTGREILGCCIMFAAIVIVQLPGKKKAED